MSFRKCVCHSLICGEYMLVRILFSVFLTTFCLTALATEKENVKQNKQMQSCKNGVGRACNIVGMNYEFELNGFKKNYSTAAKFYEKACNLNNNEGCTNLGFFYEKGQSVQINYEKSQMLYEKGCNLKDSNGCLALGTLLEKTKNYDKAKVAYEKGIKLKSGECYNNLAIMYVYGKGVKKDLFKAKALLEKSCNLKESIGCTSLGNLYYTESLDYIKAIKYYKKACFLDSGQACYNLGVFYANGDGINQNYFKARDLYERGCKLNDGMACYHLGLLYDSGLGGIRDRSFAKLCFSKSCDLGYSKGCKKYFLKEYSNY